MPISSPTRADPPRRSVPWARGISIPMTVIVVLVFVICPLWTVAYSFTGSGLLPNGQWVGVDQYTRLWGSERWQISVRNLGVYAGGMLILSLGLGFLLAALLDQRIRAAGVFRAILLYPYALSFVATGLAWQWLLHPDFGLPQAWGAAGFAPLSDPGWAIFAVLLAGLWQGTGLVTALMLAGLRGVEDEIWQAARLDGIPAWKAHVFIVLPMLRPVIATAAVLVAASAVKLFDLVVALTDGGPGLSTEVPAKYVYDMMFENQNLGQGFAASTMMLVLVLICLLVWAGVTHCGARHDRG